MLLGISISSPSCFSCVRKCKNLFDLLFIQAKFGPCNFLDSNYEYTQKAINNFIFKIIRNLRKINIQIVKQKTKNPTVTEDNTIFEYYRNTNVVCPLLTEGHWGRLSGWDYLWAESSCEIELATERGWWGRVHTEAWDCTNAASF